MCSQSHYQASASIKFACEKVLDVGKGISGISERAFCQFWVATIPEPVSQQTYITAMLRRSIRLVPSFSSHFQGAGGARTDVNLACGLHAKYSSESTSDEIDVDVHPYKTHRCEGPSTTVRTNKEELLDMHRKMYLVRSHSHQICSFHPCDSRSMHRHPRS